MSFVRAGVLALSLTCFASPSFGVIVAGGDGTQNITAPGGLTEFYNVGARETSGSGIYLGDGVVLTAAHVGAGPITLGGITFNAEGGSSERLVDPDTNQLTDLLLYRIVGDPGLPSLNIATSTASIGTSITMVGNGRNRATALTYWDVTGGVWTEQPNAAGAERAGYKWLTSNTIRHGANETEDADLIGAPAGATLFVDTGWGDVQSIYTIFDNVNGEGQAAALDSGGAFFDDDGNLVGMMHSIGTFTNQPGSTAVFGNVTFAADLSYYRDQIITYIPEPASAGLLVMTGLLLGARRRRA